MSDSVWGLNPKITPHRNITRFEELPSNATIFGRNQSAEVLRPGLMRQLASPTTVSTQLPPVADLTSLQDNSNNSSNSTPTPPIPSYPPSLNPLSASVRRLDLTRLRQRPTHVFSATDAQLYRSGICETLLDRRRTSATRSPQTQRPPSPLDNFAVSQRRERGGVNTTLKVLNVRFAWGTYDCALSTGSSRRQANLASTSPRQRIFALFSAFSACQRRALFALSIDVPRAGCALTLPSMSSASRERRAAARTLDAIHRRPASGTRVRTNADYVSDFSQGSKPPAGSPHPQHFKHRVHHRLEVNVAAVDAAPRSGANLCLCTSPSAERRLSQVLTIQVLVRRPTMVYIGERGILPIDVRRATIVILGEFSNTQRIDVRSPAITVWIAVRRADFMNGRFQVESLIVLNSDFFFYYNERLSCSRERAIMKVLSSYSDVEYTTSPHRRLLYRSSSRERALFQIVSTPDIDDTTYRRPGSKTFVSQVARALFSQ
ncbi:hypothetical protein R3P38DRAFT_2760767 [Favolaschia claudopus]|uniref:Uncharacterized protein n=1 Tax=Favolaschia claudopus TaxID=2862362 RepID=A0AAW0DV98_9AGAR